MGEGFQSTLPARGATTVRRFFCATTRFQSTLPARGATKLIDLFGLVGKISIHAPRTGSDGFPTPLAALGRTISIHAPRTGSDFMIWTNSTHGLNFNPRSPHGERLVALQDGDAGRISIHAPRTGSDVFADAHGRITAHFNPRSPHGERRSSPSAGNPA